MYGYYVGALQILIFHTKNNNDPTLWYGNDNTIVIKLC